MSAEIRVREDEVFKVAEWKSCGFYIYLLHM